MKRVETRESNDYIRSTFYQGAKEKSERLRRERVETDGLLSGEDIEREAFNRRDDPQSPILVLGARFSVIGRAKGSNSLDRRCPRNGIPLTLDR